MAYDLTTPVGKVRLMIPDRDSAAQIFADQEIETFLEIEEGSLKRATALALETISSDQVLLLKVIKLQHLETDGSKVAKALLDRASALRVQASPAAEEDDDPDGQFEIVSIIKNQFAAREQRWNSQSDW